MDKVIRQPEIIEQIAEKTGFFKKNIKEMLDALEDVVVENMSVADEKTEIHFMKGLTVGAYLKPECEARDPRNQEVITSPAKVVPFAKYTQAFKNKINE